jgi:histidinol dehydrogenase
MLDLIDARNEQGPARVERPATRPVSDVVTQVSEIVTDVRLRGDAALQEYTAKFDGAGPALDPLQVEPRVISAARDLVPRELIAALEAMVTTCRETAGRSVPESWLDRQGAATVGEMVRPLRRAGIYIDGPRANPATVVAGAVTAQVAGVAGVAVCTPPDASGEISEDVLAACAVTGINEVYAIGGAQAIAALAYGTETVRPVERVVGAGGRYVTAAQRLVRGWVGIGPESTSSELVIVADETSSPRLVAADLIVNASGGPGGTHVVLTAIEDLLEEVVTALDAQVASLPESEDVENALIEGGRGVLVRDLGHALDTVNAFAPQHLMLAIARPQDALDKVRKAGSVTLGDAASISALAYLSGHDFLVPGGGTARWDSSLTPRDFVTTIPVSGTDGSALRGAAGEMLPLMRAAGSTADHLALSVRLDR